MSPHLIKFTQQKTAFWQQSNLSPIRLHAQVKHVIDWCEYGGKWESWARSSRIRNKSEGSNFADLKDTRVTDLNKSTDTNLLSNCYRI